MFGAESQDRTRAEATRSGDGSGAQFLWRRRVGETRCGVSAAGLQRFGSKGRIRGLAIGRRQIRASPQKCGGAALPHRGGDHRRAVQKGIFVYHNEEGHALVGWEDGKSK